MSRKKDDADATLIAFIVIWVCCSLLVGWVAGGIIAFVLMISESSMSSSKNKSNKGGTSKNKSKSTKSIFEMIEEDKIKAEKKKKQQLEKEMDDYGLSEEEKKLVRTGEWETYQFDEEDPDEDDYYYEDDD